MSDKDSNNKNGSNGNSDGENPCKRLKTEEADGITVPIQLSDYVQAHILEKQDELRKQYVDAKPYQHGVFQEVFRPEFIRQVTEEIKMNSKVNFKESDLFRVYQSIDMANLTEQEHRDTYPAVLELRRVLYSSEWRSLMERICGLEAGTLTGKVDCACNCHMTGCHLLCHDDVIGTRKISYILFLTESDWDAKEGGALELYDRIMEPTDNGNSEVCAVPTMLPTGTLLPILNHMAFFTVEPGVSFHAVQEVLGDRPRLSLQGWYHAAKVPERIEAATLQQLKSTAAEQQSKPFTPLVYPTPAAAADENNHEFSDDDKQYLAEYLHETYLTDDAMETIRGRFEQDSSVQLRNFFKKEWAEKIHKARSAAEVASRKVIGEPGYYEQGVSKEWKLVGPAHKQRFLEYQEGDGGVDVNLDSSPGALLQHIKEMVLCSVPFQRFLAKITSLGLPLGYRGNIRQFRKGLDYTVAHYGLLTKKAVLDATLCFVAGDGQQVGAEEEDVREDGNNDSGRDGGKEPNKEDIIWQSGDAGGFECYIEADDDDDARNNEAADEYNEDDSTELLSVSASNNTLSLVYRDPGTMRFVKYVGSSAPSSRWDIAMEYEVEDNDEKVDDEDPDKGEEEPDEEGKGEELMDEKSDEQKD